jgi:hypothetical protein
MASLFNTANSDPTAQMDPCDLIQELGTHELHHSHTYRSGFPSDDWRGHDLPELPWGVRQAPSRI